MLARPQRLRTYADFQRVFRGGKRVQGEDVFLKVRPSQKGSPRLGIVVSKKVAKKAVRRNRIRRILSSAMQGLLPKLEGRYDIVVVALPSFSLENSQQAERQLQHLFETAALIPPS